MKSVTRSIQPLNICSITNILSVLWTGLRFVPIERKRKRENLGPIGNFFSAINAINKTHVVPVTFQLSDINSIKLLQIQQVYTIYPSDHLCYYVCTEPLGFVHMKCLATIDHLLVSVGHLCILHGLFSEIDQLSSMNH